MNAVQPRSEMALPNTVAEHYRTSEQYAPFEQEHRGGGSFGLAVMDVRQDAGEFIDPSFAEMTVFSGRNMAGSGELNFGDGWRRYDFRTGWVDIMPAHTVAEFRIPPLHLRGVSVSADVVGQRLSEISVCSSVLSAVTGRVRHLPRAAACIERMWTVAEHDGPSANLDIDAAFLSLLAELLRACGDERLLTPPPPVGDKRIARAIDYIEAHLDQPLTVGELAEIACMSVFHFGRVFKQHTGETAHAYVIARRIERAKDLMLRTELDLTSIALICGFASHSHLTHRFRRATGASPGEWRKAARG